MLIELAEPFNALPVEMAKVSGARLLWRERSAHDSSGLSDSQFVDSYSWVTKKNFLADETSVCDNVTRTMFAERYGGAGLATNGGGARVVNFNDVQIKGVGANALAGEGAPRSHSYGGLDIQGAVKEIIYSRLLNRISPVGTQAIHGLILLDKTSALHNGDPAPSVLLVRERVGRPAHFLPCVNFRVKPEHRALMRSDYSRVLGIYKSIGRRALLSEFYALTQQFLDKCADQLTFFRMARLVHGALAPSNIGLDGRVLDTALCSFIVSGSNYGQVTSYFEEAATPPLVVREWFYLINKFLADKPAEEHFYKLYEEKCRQYVSLNLGFIFGLDRDTSTKLSITVEWARVMARVFYLLSSGSPVKSTVLPTVDAKDFFNDIVTASLYAIVNDCTITKPVKFLSEFTAELKALIKIIAPYFGCYGENERSLYRALAIQTIKRAVLSSFFFITYIGRAVDEHYAVDGIDGTARLIDEMDGIAGWIYESLLSERTTIYSGGGISISYSAESDEFSYSDGGGTDIRGADVQTLRRIVDQNKSGYAIRGFDFYSYLSRLLALLDGDAVNSFNGVRNVFR